MEMNRQEYIEIKNRAWNWYKNGMTSWILATIKDFANAPYENCKIAVCPYCKNDCGYEKYVECQNCGMKFQTIAD